MCPTNHYDEVGVPRNNICSEPVGDFVPDKVVTVVVSGPSAAGVTPIDVLMHSVKRIFYIMDFYNVQLS